MPYKMIVPAKQVPDTKNITGDAMKEDGTVNRSALPAIFNPEDLNALEMALSIKERYGGHITVLSMGPPRAAEISRESLMRGADDAALICDRRAAVADTLATAYTLSCAVGKVGDFDLILCGRQAIDGDTAQVGPQLAGKLNIPQITYVEEIREIANGAVEARRNIEGGYEIVRARLPALLTIVDTANEPRPPAAKLLMRYKKARTPTEVKMEVGEEKANDEIRKLDERGLLLKEWDIDSIGADFRQCGFAGSPTQVMNIESVVLTAGEHKIIPPTPEGLAELVRELVEGHALD